MKGHGAGWIIALVMGLAAPLILGIAVLGSRSPKQPEFSLSGCGTAGVLASGWTTPIGARYSLTSGFGYRSNPTGAGSESHTGQDLAGPYGSPVLAASAGTVNAVVDLGGRSYGLHIRITHPGGVETIYGHLSATSVHEGQVVQAGQQIGAEGSSGRSTGAHLHYEIRVNSHPVDPIPFMAARGVKLDGSPGGAPTDRPPVDAIDTSRDTSAAAGPDLADSLSPTQLQTATTIINVGQQLNLPPKAWVVALSVSMQESSLGANPASQTPDTNGDMGAFGQRSKVGWYADGNSVEENVAILRDVAYTAKTFYLGHDVTHGTGAGPLGYHIPGLVDIAGWQDMPVTKAAQLVQRSAYPDAYARHQATAETLVERLSGTTNCAAPAQGNTAGEKAYNTALRYLGTPYSWGGGTTAGPSNGICCSPGGQDGRAVIGFDCSGLALAAWHTAGVTLPRTAAAQHAAVTPVPATQIQAGDLLFFDGDAHMGIADGKGGMIHAPRPGKDVQITPDVLNDPYYGPLFNGAGRPTAPTS